MRLVGSNAVTVPSDAPSGPMWNVTAPPSRGSRSVWSIQALMPSALAMASQTCSGVAATVSSSSKR